MQAAALARLTAIYKLDPGQILRRIPAPFPSDRQIWADAEFPYAKGAANLHSIGFMEESGGTLRWTYMRYPAPTLRSVAEGGLKAEWYQLAGLDSTLWQPGDSDWVIREQATLEQRLTGLADLITSETGEQTRFERKQVKRPCIIMRRDVEWTHSDSRSEQRAVVCLDPGILALAKEWDSRQYPPSVRARPGFDEVSKFLDAPFYNEAKGQYCLSTMYLVAEDAVLRRTDADYLAKFRQILDNIASQVGGAWSIEDRDVETWELVVE